MTRCSGPFNDKIDVLHLVHSLLEGARGTLLIEADILHIYVTHTHTHTHINNTHTHTHTHTHTQTYAHTSTHIHNPHSCEIDHVLNRAPLEELRLKPPSAADRKAVEATFVAMEFKAHKKRLDWVWNNLFPEAAERTAAP
jgi:hypothetical protein